MSETLLAVDLGATSGRVMAGTISHSKISLEQVARFPNGPIRFGKNLYWDIDALVESVKSGLRKACDAYPNAKSVGIDSWGVDYCLLSGDEKISQPHHYRDPKNLQGVSKIKNQMADYELFKRNGLQFLPFNTIYQLASEDFESGLNSGADSLLLIPDYFNFILTGKRITEVTNASTTGLLAVLGDEWDSELIKMTGAPAGIFQEIISPGQVVGNLSPAVRDYLGQDLQVISVASHDTASAIVATPIAKGSAYISCGTWGLVGLELDKPVLSEAAKNANFTNERGLDSTYRFLHNVMGLWLLNETVSFWREQEHDLSIEELIKVAEKVDSKIEPFDVNDSRFLEPGNMPARISGWYQENELHGPRSRPEFVWAILNSIAFKFAQTIAKAGELAQIEITDVVMVGGGSQSELLCRLTAQHANRSVRTGPVEATALGNLLVQAVSRKLIPNDMVRIRELISVNFHSKTYSPNRDT